VTQSAEAEVSTVVNSACRMHRAPQPQRDAITRSRLRISWLGLPTTGHEPSRRANELWRSVGPAFGRAASCSDLISDRDSQSD
jgi:hypothetical protein